MTDTFDPDPTIPPRVLATDLDGTLIPFHLNLPHQHALEKLRLMVDQRDIPVVFATGRRYDSVIEAIHLYRLPIPDWIICDVGTSIYQNNGVGFETFAPYDEHLDARIGAWDRPAVEARMEGIRGLELQEPIHQQRFKVSFQCEPERVEGAVVEMTAACQECGFALAALGSVDPFENRGLIDLLPVGVNKAYALVWLSTHADFRPEEVVFSGDSGNDLAGLVSGFRATVVSNASDDLKSEIRRIAAARNLTNRIYFARDSATCGVLEGAIHHGLL